MSNIFRNIFAFGAALASMSACSYEVEPSVLTDEQARQEVLLDIEDGSVEGIVDLRVCELHKETSTVEGGGESHSGRVVYSPLNALTVLSDGRRVLTTIFFDSDGLAVSSSWIIAQGLDGNVALERKIKFTGSEFDFFKIVGGPALNDIEVVSGGFNVSDGGITPHEDNTSFYSVSLGSYRFRGGEVIADSTFIHQACQPPIGSSPGTQTPSEL